MDVISIILASSLAIFLVCIGIAFVIMVISVAKD